MNPALTNPFCSVYMVSEGSMGETVLPISRHCTMWAIMNRFRAINAAARHLLVPDLRMPVSCCSRLPILGRCVDVASDAGRRRSTVATVPSFFDSRPRQLLFTKLANLLQNPAFATEQIVLGAVNHLSNFRRNRISAEFSLRFQSAHGKDQVSTLRGFRIRE